MRERWGAAFAGILAPGEVIHHASRRHVIVLVVPLSLAGLAAVLLLTTLCPLSVAIFLLVAAAVLVGDWSTTWFILTDTRLIVARAPAWRRVRSLQLAAIDGLTLRVDLVGRIVGFGDVVADSAAVRGGRLILDYAPEPETWHQRLASVIGSTGLR